MKTEQDLIKLKKKVEDSARQESELKGQLTALTKQLKDDYGCKSVEDANVKLEEMLADLKAMDKQITKGISELEEKYSL